METLEESRLNEATLLKLGKETTKLRVQFELLAAGLVKKSGEEAGTDRLDVKRKSFFDV